MKHINFLFLFVGRSVLNTLSLSTVVLLFSSSAIASGSNPFETTPKLKEYAQQASAAVRSQHPEYFPLILLDDAERETVYQYLRGELQKPMQIYQLILLDYPRLRLLRNEIFARHGRKFTSPDLDTYFRHSSWYVPSQHFSEASLNPVERENIALIARTEYVHFHRHEKMVKILKFSDEEGSGSLQVPDVSGLVSVRFDGCCGSSWGNTAIQDQTGKIRFSSSFGYDGGSGTMHYLVPHWGKNLIAWISGEVEKEPKTHDRIVVLSVAGEPLVDARLPSGLLPAEGYGGRLQQVVLLSPDVLYVNATENGKHEQHLFFLKKRLEFKPQTERLFQWRDHELAADDIQTRCEQKQPGSAIAPIYNPAVLWDKQIKSRFFPVVVTKSIAFFVPVEDTIDYQHHRIIALDRLTGKEQWVHEATGQIGYVVSRKDHLAISTWSIHENVFTYRLRLLNGQTGALQWDVADYFRQELNTVPAHSIGLLLTEDRLVEAIGGKIDILDLSSGKRLNTIDLTQNEKTKHIPFQIETWMTYSGKLYYYTISHESYTKTGRDTLYLVSVLPSGDIEWTYSTEVTSFGTENRVQFVGCNLYILDVNSAIQVDLATGKSKVINRKPGSNIIDYQANLLLPLKKTISWLDRDLRFRLQHLADGKLNCIPTFLDGKMIYISDSWPFKTVRLLQACPEKNLINNEPQLLSRWSFAPWNQDKDFSNYYPNIDPIILHVDHNYLFVKTGDHYWAIGEKALVDFTHRTMKGTW